MLVCCIIIAGDHLNKSAVDNLIFVGRALSLLLLITLDHCICFEPTSLLVGPPCDLHGLSVLLACPHCSRNFNTYLLKCNCLNAYFPKPVNLFCASIFSTNVNITSTLFCFSVPCKYYRYVFVFNSSP